MHLELFSFQNQKFSIFNFREFSPTYQNQKPSAPRKTNIYSPYLSEKEAKKGLETGQFRKVFFFVNLIVENQTIL